MNTLVSSGAGRVQGFHDPIMVSPSTDFEAPHQALSARSPAQTQAEDFGVDQSQRVVKAQLKKVREGKALHVFASTAAITVGILSFPLTFARSVLGIVPRIAILVAKSTGYSCEQIVNHSVTKALLGEYAVDKLQRADTKQVAIQALKAELTGGLVLSGFAAGMVAAALVIPSMIVASLILAEGPIFTAVASPYTGAISDSIGLGHKVHSLITKKPDLFRPLMSMNVFDAVLNQAYTDQSDRYRVGKLDDNNQNQLASLEKPKQESRFKASSLFHLFRAGNLNSFSNKLFFSVNVQSASTLPNRFDSFVKFSEAQAISHTRSELEMLNMAKSMVPADHPIQEDIQKVQSSLQFLDAEIEAISKMTRQEAVEHVFSQVKGRDHYAMTFDVHGDKGGHATILAFDKIPGTQDQYNVTLINRGEGINNHLTVQKGGVWGKKKVAAARVFPNVQITDSPDAGPAAFTKETLTKLMVDAYKYEGKVSSKLDAVYKLLDAVANYNPNKFSNGPKNWREYNQMLLDSYPDFAAKVVQAPQKDGNCTYSCIRGYERFVSDSKESFLRVDNLLANLRLQAAQEFVRDVSTGHDSTSPVVERVLYLMTEKVIPSLEKKLKQSNQRVAGLAMPDRVTSYSGSSPQVDSPEFMEPIVIREPPQFDDDFSVNALPDLNDNEILLERDNQFLITEVSSDLVAGALRQAGHTNFRATGTENKSWLRAAWVGVLSSFDSSASLSNALINKLNPKLPSDSRLSDYDIATLISFHEDMTNPLTASEALGVIGNARGADHASRNLNALGNPGLEERLARVALQAAALSETIREDIYLEQTMKVSDGKEASFELIEPLFSILGIGLIGVEKSQSDASWQMKGNHNTAASDAVRALHSEFIGEPKGAFNSLENQVVLLRRNDQHFQVFIPNKQ